MFCENYTTPVTIASAICNTVVISGLCPRLDDKMGNIYKGNNCLEKIVNDNNLLDVDNDCQFRLLNGAVNAHLYTRSGVHLNAKGVSKIAGKLDIMPIKLIRLDKARQRYIQITNLKNNNIFVQRKEGKIQAFTKGNLDKTAIKCITIPTLIDKIQVKMKSKGIQIVDVQTYETLYIRFTYGSWIYNYLCNQYLSPLTLRIRILLRRGVLDTILRDKVCQ